jgi:hypothetical protein
MATLKTTVRIESPDLFPQVINFTNIATNQINGSFNGFNTITVELTDTKLNSGLIDGVSKTAYCYFSAPLTNLQTVLIRKGTDIDAFIKLAPGDIAVLPYGSMVATDNLYAYIPAVGSATLTYFIGERD